MRMTIGVAVLLAGCAGVSAQDVDTSPRPSGGLSPLRAAPSALPRANEDALNRQVAMDRRMDARTKRVIGSVCLGCGGAERRTHGRSGNGATDPAAGEAPVADPAEAPLD
ncbi:hypothetical protein [Methylobacterium thuringiense]|uniref:Secreted protein n=1 Tax=Methylobacterium thuringiense TaxID=1003091 RepID=A0ABQ4TR26_9HYPH|nr:hypothetical protein [Methylobacterium thuringiense]GJE57137.1 hypothetical protein EKPJFOCH_3649 [Methylobacterium thuringiense]